MTDSLKPYFRAAAIVALTAIGFSSITSCGGPRMKRLDTTTYRRRPSIYPIDIYIGDVAQSHKDIAILESTAYANDDNATREKQVEEIKHQARKLGADAVDDVRILTKQIKGYTVDERTPFLAWKQGQYPLYFLRGKAIVYDSGLAGAVGAGRGFTTGPQAFIPPASNDAKTSSTMTTTTDSGKRKAGRKKK